MKLPVICPFCDEEVNFDWSKHIVDQEKSGGDVEKMRVVCLTWHFSSFHNEPRHSL